MVFQNSQRATYPLLQSEPGYGFFVKNLKMLISSFSSLFACEEHLKVFKLVTCEAPSKVLDR